MTSRSPARPRARSSVVAVSAAGGEVRVLAAETHGGELRVLRSAQGALTSPAARSIAQALAGAGIRERRVVVCLPARSVVVRRAILPPAGREQLAQLAGYEAQRHLPLPIDQLAVGYSARPDPAGNAVTLVIARREELSALERELAAEGITVEGYAVDGLTMPDGFECAAGSNGNAQLLVAPVPGVVHLLVRRGTEVLRSRSISRDSPAWLGELRSTAGAYAIDHPEAPIEEVVLLGEEDRDKVEQAAFAPTRRAAPLAVAGLDNSPEWAALVGLARQWLDPAGCGTFLPPQGWEKPSAAGGRSGALLGVAAAVVAVAALTAWQLDRQQARSRETEQVRRLVRQNTRDRRLAGRLRAQRDGLRVQAAALGSTASRLAAVDVLGRVAARVPAEVWLTQVTYQEGKPLQIQGTARGDAQVTAFLRALERTRGLGRADLGYLRSAAVDEVPVTHFRIDCTPTMQADRPARTAGP